MAFNWKLWGKGLVAALIGSASTTAAAALSNPATLHDPKSAAAMIGVGAALGGLSYLKTHPPVDALPDGLEPLAVAGIGAAVTKLESRLPTKPAA